MTRAETIASITEALQANPDIRALFLSGSYGAGIEDRYSDIDFLAVAVDGASDSFADIWRRAVGLTGEIVLWWDRPSGRALINAITHEWVRIDVVAIPPLQMKKRKKQGLKVLFDHDGIIDALPDTPREDGPDSNGMKWQIEEFIRILGLLSVAMGREEYINAVTGVFHLRNLLINLLIEETAAPNRGGALHLNRLITEDQKALLLSLPPLTPDRNAAIEAYLAYAEAYLPRARRMAERMGIEWPERFEEATWTHLSRTLNIWPTDMSLSKG